uniref:Uncharacterized protein n=1 Tax=Anguilla anguilla TaxID=7936 RepID=A0A0E9QRZ5_ANGAN
MVKWYSSSSFFFQKGKTKKS